MLKNGYYLAKIGADTAEIEQHFAENLPIRAAVLRGAPAGAPRPGRPAFDEDLERLDRRLSGVWGLKKY